MLVWVYCADRWVPPTLWGGFPERADPGADLVVSATRPRQDGPLPCGRSGFSLPSVAGLQRV